MRVNLISRNRPDEVPRGEDAALAAIVRSSHDAVIAKTVDGVITRWNEGARFVYGQTAKQMLGQNVECMIPAAKWPEERARHARVAAGHAESGYRCCRLRVDGRAIEVVMSMSPMRDRSGQVIGVASISRPVSVREDADSRFASLMEAAPDATVCVDAAGYITMVNERVSSLFGYDRDELVGAPLDMLVPDDVQPDDATHSADFARHLHARQAGAGSALRARRRDGATFPVEVSLGAHGVGSDVIIIAAIRDVTEERALQSAAHESETRLRQLADNVEHAFTLTQLEPPGYLYISPAFQTLTGLSPEEVMANPALPMDLVHPDDRARVERELFVPCGAGLAGRSEFRIVRGDGEVRWNRTFATPVPNPHGAPERMVSTTEDITERIEVAQALKAAEAAAWAANDAKNAFLSRISHELRTPLNAVLGFGQLLERRLEGTEDADSVRYILRAGRHLLDLINEVLDIARIESGEMSVSPEPIPLISLIQESADFMQPIAAAADVTLHVMDDSPDIHVLADRQRLRQILLNLLSNAIKYNHENGNVWITGSSAADGVVISVRDDGRGIAPGHFDRIFTPFDRLGAEATGIEGTGVGLAVTRALVELMNGSVSVESEAGAGSCFAVTLPEVLKPAVDVLDASAYAPHPVVELDAVTTTLLYIEDNDPNVRVVEALLKLRPGWRMLHAGLGRLGVELAQAHHPDLVLLDLHLPDSLGIDVLAALQSDDATADIPVVILTADANPHQLKRLLASGASHYLTKPLDIDVVLHLLDEVAAEKIVN